MIEYVTLELKIAFGCSPPISTFIAVDLHMLIQMIHCVLSSREYTYPIMAAIKAKFLALYVWTGYK